MYRFVQHYAHIYTVKLYSFVLVMAATIIRYENSTDQNTPSNSRIFLLLAFSSLMMMVATTKTCRNIAWLYKYVQSAGPTCRQ